MKKRTTATLRKARRYAAGGALEKSDMGDFTQNDQLSMIKRAVLNQYLGNGAGPGPNVTTATRSPGPVVSNAAAKGDLGAPANMTRPDIFTGIPREPDTLSEEESYRRMGPVDRYASGYRAPDPNADPATDVAYNTPLVGNALSARDAVVNAAHAGQDVHEGRYKSAGLNGLLAALSAAGALSPVPFGRTAGNAARGASSRANVFVNAADSPKAPMAAAMYDQPATNFKRLPGGKNETVFRETGIAIGPDGVPVREIPDAGMRRVPRRWSGGDQAPLKDVVAHPDLFAERPNLGEIPVKFEQTPYGRQPIARTSDKGFELSTDWKDKWLRTHIAKLLQYTASKEGNMAAPLRHDVGGTLTHLDKTMDAVKAGIKNEELPAGAALAYMDHLQSEKDKIAQFMAKSDGPIRDTRQRLAFGLSERSAGNILAQITKKRVTEPGGYPFKDAPPFNTQLVLPHRLDPASLGEFVGNWHRNGAGRPGYASGGKVKGALSKARAKLATGGLVGHTGGRSDELPVKAAEGSYVIPADVVSALGEGNTMAGNKILFGRFPGALGGGVKKPHLARGGAVDIVVSDGEFIIPPDEVAKLGKGDLKYGHDVLDAFVTNTRKQHIQTLAALPGPKT